MKNETISEKTSAQTGIEMRCGDLKSALVGLGKVITTKRSSEELSCVKVEARDPHTVQLTATDGTITLRLDLPARSTAKGAAFLVSLTQLRDQVRKRSAGETITMGPPSPAPAVTAFTEDQPWRGSVVPLPDDAVTSLLRAFICGSNDKTRYVLQGAYLDVSDKGRNAHRIVATDGRQLFSSNSRHLPNLKASIILPDHKLWTWKALAESRPWTLRVGKPAASEGAQRFRIDGAFWSVSGTAVDGNYPNYRQVIPADSEFKTRIMLSDSTRATMARLLPALPGSKLKHQPIGIQLRNQQLFLLARDNGDQAWQPHPLGPCEVRGPDVTVQINRDYLSRLIDFDLHEIAIIDEMSPVRFKRDGDLMIIMPLRPTGSDQIAKPVAPLPQPTKRAQQVQQTKPGQRKTVAHHSVPMTEPKATAHKPSLPEVDPMVAAEAQIAEARQALASAHKGLISAHSALKSVRRQQRETDKEVRGVRSLLKRLRKHQV